MADRVANHIWQDGRPNWDTGEVRLWIMNTPETYYPALACGTSHELCRKFTHMSGPTVDWSIIDWEWLFDRFKDDREDET